jgi:hypothetical protein
MMLLSAIIGLGASTLLLTAGYLFGLNDLPAKAGRLSWRGINPRLKRFAAD